MPYAVGDLTESFTLPRARGGEATIETSGAPATVLVWTCNHCPYALAWPHPGRDSGLHRTRRRLRPDQRER